MMLDRLITLPQESPGPPGLSELAVRAIPGKRSALVVDDDPDIAPIVELALARFGFEVSAVSDGASALVRLRSRVFDLVILDLGMAELDGFEVLKAM